MEEILRLFPVHIMKALEETVAGRFLHVEEIRLRLHQAIELNFHQHVEWIEEVIFTEEDSTYVLNQLSGHSLYRLEDELREGYITIRGGHRVGLAGEASTVNGRLQQLQHITFFNIRIAKEIPNVALPFIHAIREDTAYCNTLIIGAPQTGKTTILRDVARLIGNGYGEQTAKKVGIIDERSEIAASLNGIPQHEVGRRTDIIDACPKVEGLMMMIRSMSPEVLIVDEIGKQADVQALMEAMFAGVKIICTVHGTSIAEIKQRPSLHVLFTERAFERYIVLGRNVDQYFSVDIMNQHEQKVESKQVLKQ